jgi:hypothetical protein
MSRVCSRRLWKQALSITFKFRIRRKSRPRSEKPSKRRRRNDWTRLRRAKVKLRKPMKKSGRRFSTSPTSLGKFNMSAV